MTTTTVQKQAIPQARGHLQLVHLERTPEQHFDLELAEAVNSLVPPREARPLRFYKLAKGELFPGRVLARIVDDALRANVDPAALLRALWRPIRALIERKSARRMPRRLAGWPEYKRLPSGPGASA